MNIRTLTYVLLALVGLAATGWAVDLAATRRATDTPPLAKPCSMAVVNITSAFDQLDEKKEADADLAKRFKEPGETLQAREKDLAAMKERIDKLEAGDDKSRQTAEMQLEAANFQAAGQKFKADIERTQIEMTLKLYGKMMEAVEALRVKNDYDVVLTMEAVPDTRSITNRGGLLQMISMRKVLAANPRIDLTPALVEYMNAAYGKGAPKK